MLAKTELNLQITGARITQKRRKIPGDDDDDHEASELLNNVIDQQMYSQAMQARL